MRIEIDSEELEVLIDFHESMANDAADSCEYEEVKWRRQRVTELRSLRKRWR